MNISHKLIRHGQAGWHKHYGITINISERNVYHKDGTISFKKVPGFTFDFRFGKTSYIVWLNLTKHHNVGPIIFYPEKLTHD